MFKLFVAGGAGFMAFLTIILIAICLAAWKAPAWVAELGKMAIVVGFFAMMLGLTQVCGFIQQVGDVSLSVFCGGMKVAMIAPLYGFIIYFLSLIIRIIQKPRI